MTESGIQEAAAAMPVTSKSKKAAVPKAKTAAKQKNLPNHPSTAQMVDNAIKNLKERGGSSLQAIKKYISSTYKVDAEKSAPFIKKYLKQAVDKGQLIQTKGKGASGSFKLATIKSEKVAKKKVVKPKVKKPKAETAKTATKPKKEKTVKKKVVSSTTPKVVSKPKTTKPKSAVPKKTTSKAEKTTKAPATKKLKSPKPKKVTVTKKAVKKPAAAKK